MRTDQREPGRPRGGRAQQRVAQPRTDAVGGDDDVGFQLAAVGQDRRGQRSSWVTPVQVLPRRRASSPTAARSTSSRWDRCTTHSGAAKRCSMPAISEADSCRPRRVRIVTCPSLIAEASSAGPEAEVTQDPRGVRPQRDAGAGFR